MINGDQERNGPCSTRGSVPGQAVKSWKPVGLTCGACWSNCGKRRAASLPMQRRINIQVLERGQNHVLKFNNEPLCICVLKSVTQLMNDETLLESS